MEIDISISVEVPDEHVKILAKFPRAELAETCAATSHQAINKMLAMLIVAYQGGYVDDDLQMVEGSFLLTVDRIRNVSYHEVNT
jgi:hypothetical protein